MKRIDYGEADRILTIFSKNKGKITAMAKGVRRMESRKGGNVELFNHTAFLMAEGRGMDIVTEAEVINSFSQLRENLELVSYTYHLIELVDQFTEEVQENYQLFILLLEVLRRVNGFTGANYSSVTLGGEASLESDNKIKIYLRAFEVKLLNLIGYRPQLSDCVHCNRSLLPENNFFSPFLGGIVCQECVNIDSDFRPISKEAIKVVRFLQDRSWDQVEKLKISLDLQLEVEQQLREYIEFLLEKELKSAKFIERVKNTKG